MRSLNTFSLSTIVCTTMLLVIAAAISCDSKADKNKNVCASCGIAEGDDVKLRSAMTVTSFDIVVINVGKIIERSIG